MFSRGHVKFQRSPASAPLFQALLLATMVACSPDTPVPPPPCRGDACPADVSAADTQDTAGDVAPDTTPASLTFSLDTKTGNVLVGTTDSAVLQFSDDKYPDVAGTQVDVVIATTGLADNTQVQVAIDNTVVGSAVISNNAARINKVTIGCSSVPKSIVVSAQPSAGAPIQVAKSVQLDCSENACTATLADPPPCLTDDVDPGTPGFQATFTVKTTTPDCTDAYITLIDADGKPGETARVSLSGSSAAIKVTLASNDKGLVSAKAKLVAHVIDNSQPGRDSVASPEKVVTITTEVPVITVTQPLPGQLTLKDDADPATPGIQATLVGTATTMTTADIGQIQLFIDGTATAVTTLLVDNTFQFALSFPESKTYSVKIVATNACGLQGETKPLPYSVFAGQAGLVIQSPTANQVLLAKDDGDPKSTTLYETQVVLALQAPTANSEVSVFCKKAGPGATYGNTASGTAVITDASAPTVAVPVSLDVELLGTDVICFAKDNAPNSTQTLEVQFKIGLPAPCLNLVLPADAVTVTQAKLVMAASAVNLDGVAVTARITSSTGVQYELVTLGKVDKGLLQTTLPLQFGQPLANLPDGTYTVSIEATDAFGNLASLSACSTVSRKVTLDTAGPVLAITLPTKATLTTLDDADADAGQPGYQIDVTIAVSDAKQVCLTANGVLFACAASAGTSEVKFKGVTLQPGANTLVVNGTDVNGNVTLLAPQAITLISDAPVVAIVTPPGSVSTANDKLAVLAKVTDAAGNGVTGAVTEVQINGSVDASIVVTDQGNGVYAFEVGNISAAPQTKIQFGAAAVGAADKKGYSSILTITFKSTKPTAPLTSPADGTVFNLASAACVPGVKACVTKIKVDTPNVEDGAIAKLAVNCGAGDVTYSAPVLAAAVVFDDVQLNDQAICSIVASVVDLAGQQASSTKVTVSIDRTAPNFIQLASPLTTDGALTLLAGADLNADPTDGMQVSVQITLTGLPSGAKVQLDVFDDAGKKTNTVQCPVLADISDVSQANVACGVVSLPDGFKVKLQFAAADPAGNPAAKVVVGEILSSQPDMNIFGPPNAPDIACTTSAECSGGACAQGKCAVPWNKLSQKNVSVSTIGIPNGGAVRICSDAAGIVGAACATAGFKVVATGTISQQSAQVSLASLPDGLYTIIAEVSFLPAVNWQSSFNSTFVNGKKRRILLDTVAPTIVSLAPPSAAGVPSGCLSDKLQDQTDFFGVGGKFTFTATTDEDTTIILQNDNLEIASATTANKIANVAVQLSNEGLVSIGAVPVDLVGNIGLGKTLLPLTVNTVPPVGEFLVPSKAKILAGDSLDVKVKSTSEDVEGENVTLHDTGTPLQAVQAFINNVALFSQAATGALVDGPHNLTADLADHCANKATIATKPQTVTVDTQPPGLTFVEPAQAATFTDNQDADPIGGYQISVQFSTADTATWSLELGTECDPAFANCINYQVVQSGNATNPGGVEPKLLLTIPFGNTTNYSLRLTGTDANGNTTVVSRGFAVALSGCLVQLKGVPAGTINTQNCPVKGVSCASVVVPVTVSFFGPCGAGKSVKLLKNGAEVATAVPVNAEAKFDLTVNDGDSFELEATVLDGVAVKGSSGALAVKADLTNPAVQFVAATVLGQPTVAGNSPVQLGKSEDLDTLMAGHQVHAQLKISDTGLDGGKLLKLQRKVGVTTTDLVMVSPGALPVVVTGVAASIDIQFATLAQDATNLVTATVQDASGNIGTGSFIAVVDWEAPSALVLNDIAAADVNPRRPFVNLTFTATGDNAGVGTASSYEVRYSRKPITSEAEFLAACDANLLIGSVIGQPSPAGSDDVVTVSGPDPRPPSDACKFATAADNGATKYYFGIVAIDTAGNRSAMSNVVNTNALRLRFANINLGGGFNTVDYRARVWPVGDLNGDGHADVAFGGGATAQVCILYGHASNLAGTLPDYDLSLPTGPNHVCLANANGGLGAPVGRARDLNGDGVDDLALGNLTGAGNSRQVLIYLGKKNDKLSGVAAVTVKGIYNYGVNGVARVAGIGNFNGDVNAATKLPLNDLAVLNRPGTGTPVNYERVHILTGSAKWNEATPISVDMNNATDRTNNNVVTINLKDPGAFPFFGNFVGGVGNLLPDGDGTGAQFDDLAIGQYAGPQQVFLLKGRQVTGDVNIVFSSVCCTGANDAEAVRLAPDGLTGINAFGQYLAAVEFDGNSFPDLVIQHQAFATGAPQGGLYWVRGQALQSQLGKSISLAATLVPGETNLFTTAAGYMTRAWLTGLQSAGNFFDQPSNVTTRTDIVYGRPQKAPDGASNLVTLSADLVRPATAIPLEGSFLFADVAFGDPTKPGNPNWGVGPDTGWGGVSVWALGDFNNDGLPDLAVGSVDGGLVIVY